MKLPESARAIGNVYSLALNIFSFVVILAGVYVHYAYSFLLPAHLSKAGANQFFTVLSGWLTLAYQLLAVAAHLFQHPGTYYAKNNYLLPVALVSEFVVTAVYWLVRLVLPYVSFDVQTPFALDFAVHILPFAALLAEYVLFVPTVQIKHPAVYGKIAALASAYWVWLELTIDTTSGQKYPYVFLEGETRHRGAVFAGVIVMGCVGYRSLRFLHEWAIEGESFLLAKNNSFRGLS